MDYIKNLIFSLCGASAVVSISKLILHDSKLSKSVNIFLSLFLMFYMIAPFGNSPTDSELFNNTNGENFEDFSSENYYSDFIKLAVNKVCEQENCTAEKIEIHETDLNGETVIEYIEIKLNDETKAGVVADRLKQEYGFEVKVA